tara:strand:- start:348 stop:926 length:579 start_codon:yes stop_codon:yes gene_type:complete
METKLSAVMEQIPRSDYLKELNKRKQIEDEAMCIERLQKEKEYNEKVSDTIFGTGLRPSIVGKMNSENPHMNYDFVSFDKVEKKEPLEYIDKNKIDYDVKTKNGAVPQSFFMIKEGEIEKGKEWYLNHDPKLPVEIAEMMARYNWGDLKYMTKKSAKRDRKKLAKKGKDLGVECGLTIKHSDKNNPIIVDFD